MAFQAPDPLPTPADASPATPDMPFQALVDRFVDLDSTFADARKMSQPQIAPKPVNHLAYLPAPSSSPFKLSVLLDFLSARIDPTLTELRSHDLSAPLFLTLVVGSPAHLLAGKSLHFHLVGCFTNNHTRFHFTLHVSVGPDQCLPVPLDWAPLFTALATMCLTLPSHLHTFSSTTSLVRPNIFLRLPPGTNFTGQLIESRKDFVFHTPATALKALLTARKTTYEQYSSSRESVEGGSLTADLHFALSCTPYYGYTPASESDFIAMIYALSDFFGIYMFYYDPRNAALSNLSARSLSSCWWTTGPYPHSCTWHRIRRIWRQAVPLRFLSRHAR